MKPRHPVALETQMQSSAIRRSPYQRSIRRVPRAEDEVWTPRLTMANAAEPRDRFEVTIRADPAGQVTYVERFVVNLSAYYDLLRFPFDSQKLILDLQPSLPDRDLVTLEKAPATKTLRAPQSVRQ